MAPLTLVSAAIVTAFAAIHLVGSRLTFLRVTPRSVWLSAAGGVSVAYVFVHLLPELAEYQEVFREGLGETGLLASIESHSYLVALIGLATFYGLDRMARQSGRGVGRPREDQQPSLHVFWVHLGAFAIYNFLIGYLLLHREDSELRGLMVYAAAMGLHFLVNDHALREQHGPVYDSQGRWILAAAPFAGWALGLATSLSPLLLSALFAFLGGGIVLNVLKEELPEDRESRFWAFALGLIAYSALLLGTG
jgi:zinc transporter ZupT